VPDAAIAALTEDTFPALTDLLYKVDATGSAASDRKVKVRNLRGFQIVRKTLDETITSSTAMQDDDHLLIPVEANEVWAYLLRGFVQLSSGSAGGPKAVMVGPAASTVIHGTDAKYFNSGSTDTAGQAYADQATAVHFYADNIMRPVNLQGLIINGANAGNLKLQWAQNASTAVNTTMKAGSWLAAWRIL
jgi:hypothetical protein